MRNFFSNLKYRLAQSMQGRYGNDELGRFLWFFALICFLVSCFSRLVGWLGFFYIPGLAALIFNIFRSFSKNYTARSKERDFYVNIKSKIVGFFKLQKRRWTERKTHRFYKCPRCGQTIRVPKGRGRIQITCPKCNQSFIKTT